MLPIGFDIKVLIMPDGSDPDTVFNSSGQAGLEQLVQNSMSFFDYVYFQATLQNDVNDPWGKNQVVDSVLKFISKINSPVLRSTYCSQLANKLSLPDNAVFQELNKFRKQDHFRAKKTKYKPTEIPPPEEAVPQQPKLPKAVQKAEAGLLELSLSHGTYGKQLSESLPSNMISQTQVGEALNEVISMTLNGEWEFAENKLRAQLAENPSPEISRLLTSPSFEVENSEQQDEMQEKAFKDSLTIIKKHYHQKEINELSSRMATAEGEEKQKLMAEFNKKVKIGKTTRGKSSELGANSSSPQVPSSELTAPAMLAEELPAPVEEKPEDKTPDTGFGVQEIPPNNTEQVEF
jgi:DNA primase